MLVLLAPEIVNRNPPLLTVAELIVRLPEAAFHAWRPLRIRALVIVCVLVLLLVIPPVPMVSVSAACEVRLKAPAPELKVSERIEKLLSI
jgi:hypothetical protein